MKIINKLPLIIAFALVIFILTTCADEQSEIKGESPYQGNNLIIDNQQVWIRNKEAKKISQVYLKYDDEDEHIIDGFFDVVDAVNEEEMTTNEDETADEIEYNPEIAGTGGMKKGILNINISEPDENKHLMEWQYFKQFFSLWKNVTNNSSEIESVKGNMMILYALKGEEPIGPLDRQRIIGTDSTITQETILYFYVNKNCVITGEADSGYIDKQYFYFTEGNLRLSLHQGWNMVCRKETYGKNFSGSAYISMEIRNPITNPENFKWVIEPGFGL